MATRSESLTFEQGLLGWNPTSISGRSSEGRIQGEDASDHELGLPANAEHQYATGSASYTKPPVSCVTDVSILQWFRHLEPKEELTVFQNALRLASFLGSSRVYGVEPTVY